MTRDERGQASALLVGVLLLGLLFVGFAVDGARLFTARRDLQNVADSAALAGASEIDESVYRASGGADVRLDPRGARIAVDEIVRASSLPAAPPSTCRSRRTAWWCASPGPSTCSSWAWPGSARNASARTRRRHPRLAEGDAPACCIRSTSLGSSDLTPSGGPRDLSREAAAAA